MSLLAIICFCFDLSNSRAALWVCVKLRDSCDTCREGYMIGLRTAPLKEEVLFRFKIVSQ